MYALYSFSHLFCCYVFARIKGGCAVLFVMFVISFAMLMAIVAGVSDWETTLLIYKGFLKPCFVLERQEIVGYIFIRV